MFSSYRNYEMDLHNKSIDWFLCHNTTSLKWAMEGRFQPVTSSSNINIVLPGSTYIKMLRTVARFSLSGNKISPPLFQTK